MNATLLEKVEELTLYSSQLEKADHQKQQQQQALQAVKKKQAELEDLLHRLLRGK